MSDRPPEIARVRLARAPVRLLVAPAILLVMAAGLALAAVLWAGAGGGIGALAVGAVATVAMLAALAVATWLFSLRLGVEEAALRLRWVGGERVYLLTPGPVTRVRLQGEQASRLRARTDALGWAVGRAVLRDEEEVDVIRLAPTTTAILVPTERGRLAVAAATEAELIDALSRAAQARQRLDAMPPPPDVRPTDAGDDDERREDEPAADPAPVPVAEPAAPAFMTGIERALMEERLAREVAEAAAAAEAEAATARSAAEAAERSASEEAPAGAAGALVAAEIVAPSVAEPRSERGSTGHARPSAAFVLLPLIGSGIVWGAATLLERLPDAGSDLGRLTALALVLAGPATAVGAIMARAWWPRLVGVVVSSGLAACVFIGRAILSA